jgi:HAD superfamily hydrolase (TIGR01509 family)
MIRTIIFDLSETLIAGLLGVEKTIAAHIGISEAQILTAFNTSSLQDLFCGKLSEDEFLLSILQEQTWNISVDQLKSMVRDNFHQRVPGMETVLDNLYQHHDLVLLSDHAREWIDYIHAIHPFLQVFTTRRYSFELQQTKRKTATFDKLLANIQRQPQDCLFIDDSLVNIQSAQSVGIPCIQFTTAATLRSELIALGLMDVSKEKLRYVQ